MMPGLWGLEWHEPLFLVLRGAAAVGGAVFGWVLSAPLCRILVRAAFHRPAPALVVVAARCAGGAVLACLIFYFLPLGFGGGAGFGFGPGGNASGSGGAGGGSNSFTAKSNPGKQAAEIQNKPAPPREILDIELIGGKRYRGDDRFYLLRRQEPPVPIKDVEKLFQENKGRLEVHIILTAESVGRSHAAFQRLNNLAQKYDLPTLEKYLDRSAATGVKP
jgi:hypothetical protein